VRYTVDTLRVNYERIAQREVDGALESAQNRLSVVVVAVVVEAAIVVAVVAVAADAKQQYS